jgi:sRNA-binding carbon storage regulator CsrA
LANSKWDIKVGESVDIGGGKIIITLLAKTGRLARLDIKADKEVEIKHIKAQASSLAQNGLTYTA